MIPLVERKSGVQFQRIGAPQPVDIGKAGAKDCQVRHTQDVYICITSSRYHCTFLWRPLPIIDDLLPFMLCYLPLACCSS